MRHGKNLLYIVIALASLFVGVFASSRLSNVGQVQVLSLLVVFYLLGALVHHLRDKTLTFEVSVEYILLAGLVVVLGVSFLL